VHCLCLPKTLRHVPPDRRKCPVTSGASSDIATLPVFVARSVLEPLVLLTGVLTKLRELGRTVRDDGDGVTVAVGVAVAVGIAVAV
jgi:hypothetical protein